MKRIGTASMQTSRKLWNDQSGVVISIELILVMTVVVIGLLAGLSAYRDAVVSEIDDAAASIGELNQSYQYDEVALGGTYGEIDYRARVDGSTYTDNRDFCDDPAGTILIDASTIEDEG